MDTAATPKALFRMQEFERAVNACREELALWPEDLELRLLLVRALLALRRDTEAQHEVSVCLGQKRDCPEAYALLGELAYRRDEIRAAEIFLREAVRLQPGDAQSRLLLDVVEAMQKPAAAAAKLPAATAAAGPSPSPNQTLPMFFATGTRPPRPADEDRTSISLEMPVQMGAGFGEFLVLAGVITRQQLLAALQRHYREGVRIGQAVTELGYAPRAVVEGHARSYHGSDSTIPDVVPHGLVH